MSDSISLYKDDVKDCTECKEKNKMSHDFCCLYECGEHEFCRGCGNGIYLGSNFRTR